MAGDLFAWCPFIALVIGAVSTLGFFRSRGWGIGLACAAFFAQVVAWTIFFLAGDVQQHGWNADWQTVLASDFWTTLIRVAPYTVIGVVCGGVLIGLVRFSVGQEEEAAEEDAAEDAEHETVASSHH